MEREQPSCAGLTRAQRLRASRQCRNAEQALAHVEEGDRRQLAERLSGGMPQRLDDALRLLVRATIDNHRDNPRLHRALFDEAPRAPAFLARLHEVEQLTVETTARLLEQHPKLRAGRLNAQIVVATIESLVHRLVTSRT